MRLAACCVAVVLALGCSTADLKGPPPSSTGPTVCGVTPQIACDAGAPSGCAGRPRGSGSGPVYPVGCRAYFTAADCSTESTCSCGAAADASAPQWICQP
jgi:hypothetical protein